jgi:hypothetical protein
MKTRFRQQFPEISGFERAGASVQAWDNLGTFSPHAVVVWVSPPFRRGVGASIFERRR